MATAAHRLTRAVWWPRAGCFAARKSARCKCRHASARRFHAGRKDFKALERHFWKSVTINPPLYGADTPMSLFGSHCKGWALTDLADLLKEKGVPEIPGVTTPMSYFGMWKARLCHHHTVLPVHACKVPVAGPASRSPSPTRRRCQAPSELCLKAWQGQHRSPCGIYAAGPYRVRIVRNNRLPVTDNSQSE